MHPPGFGYLVPRPAAGYDPPGPGILGTVFDSCALAAQDQNAAHITKLTVMLGGPHTLTPTHTAVPAVLRQLSAQLGGPALPAPLLCRVHEHRACIPTLTVGHLARMEEMRAVLGSAPWGGRLEVVGAGVGGVSVGDCVEAGRGVGNGWM